MQKFFSILIISALSLAACNGESKAKTSTDSTAIAEVVTDTLAPAQNLQDTAISGCYSSIIKRDTSSLQLDIKGQVVSGPMMISIYEKDRNDGTFQGELSAGLIKGFYLFKSEGVMSVRETIFQIQDKKLIPAIGEMTQQNDTMFFKNPAKLKFDDKMVFQKVRCVV